MSEIKGRSATPDHEQECPWMDGENACTCPGLSACTECGAAVMRYGDGFWFGSAPRGGKYTCPDGRMHHVETCAVFRCSAPSARVLPTIMGWVFDYCAEHAEDQPVIPARNDATRCEA